MIPNHYSHKLSELDIRMAHHVRPGGNWKQIPTSVKSMRLAQIRESYKAGKGSRSTYYGRMTEDRPSHTISTYFNRPGNGCYLHYDYDGGQHRTISQREAARLQSFPDSFFFSGSKTAINRQIGNAIPPLLAFNIARNFPRQVDYVDLFCGAGGFSLGCSWAKWRCLIANDIDASALDTYRLNLGDRVVQGDIRHESVVHKIVSHVQETRRRSRPLIVVGGPPCQGFSTAGKRRTMADERNHLFQQYCVMLSTLKADAFVFENVPGLLNFEGGSLLALIEETFRAIGFAIQTLLISADEFGVPQKRKRVVIVGGRGGRGPLTSSKKEISKVTDATPWNVLDALSDLPPISHGQDGSCFDYRSKPVNEYQKFCRSLTEPAELSHARAPLRERV